MNSQLPSYHPLVMKWAGYWSQLAVETQVSAQSEHSRTPTEGKREERKTCLSNPPSSKSRILRL